MSLYMMSMGLLPHARPIAASYHGKRLPPESVESAEYLLAFRCEVAPPPDYEFHAASPLGCVFRRKALP
jgi:hypothetical protein